MTLAYTMADLGKQVPPFAAVFCRLFLLQQGVGDGKWKSESIEVDDVALATLVSMNVNEEDTKRALRDSNSNVDASLVWLTIKDDEMSAQDATGTFNGDPEVGSNVVDESMNVSIPLLHE